MLYENGVIIQKVDNNSLYYKGVDGDNWYLNSIDSFRIYFEENIEKSWCDFEFVDCCADMGYIKQYINKSVELGIQNRILLCETKKELPKSDFKKAYNVNFIGYDYAYLGGSYYSCVYNDLVGRNIAEFSTIKLNKNGLFETFEEVEEFIKQREIVREKYDDTVFEKGEFAIFRLSELYL